MLENFLLVYRREKQLVYHSGNFGTAENGSRIQTEEKLEFHLQNFSFSLFLSFFSQMSVYYTEIIKKNFPLYVEQSFH